MNAPSSTSRNGAATGIVPGTANGTAGGTAVSTPVVASGGLWEEVMSQVSTQLKSDDIRRIQSIATYDNFSKELESQVRKYEAKSKVHLILKKLSQPLTHLKSLSDAIRVITQYQGSPECLVWGGLMIIIDTSIKFLDTLDSIMEMLVEITSAMPRFELYLELFTAEPRLKDAVRNLYVDYVNFSVATVKFIRKRPSRVLLSMFWKPLQKEFQATLQKVGKHSAEAESWAQAASYKAQQQNELEAARRHDDVIRIFPKVAIISKEERKVCSIQVPRNPKFFQREDTLLDMFEHLKPRQVPKTQDQLRSYTLHGFGGVGKTQTSTEFVYRYLDVFPTVFWFRAETPGILRQELADAAGKAGLVPEGQSPDVAASIALFQSWLFDTDQKWLIVFDNVDKWDDIKDVWPISSHGSVLLTTRNAELANYTTGKWHLLQFKQNHGVEFLCSLLKDSTEDSRKGAEALAAEIDGYPLALSHAAGYIVTNHITCDDFLDLFRDLQLMRTVNQSSVSLSSLPQYNFTLEDVWTMSLKQLTDDGQEILNIAAFLNPDMIHQQVIESLAEFSDFSSITNEQERATATRLRHHQITTILRSLTLHTLLNRVEGKTFSIHRLLQRDLLARLQDDPQKLQHCFKKASRLIRQKFPAQHVAEPLTPFWAECQETLPHVMRLTSVYHDIDAEADEKFASLLGDAAYYQWEKGLLKEALELCYVARDILEKVADETSVHKADVLNVIGAIFIESGAAHIDEGTEIMERVLQIRKNRLQTRTESDPDFKDDFLCVSNALSNLCCCWIGLKEWQKGLETITEAISMFHRFCTEDSHPYGFAERYANLGQILAGSGKLDEGIEYVERATILQRKAFGRKDVRSCLFESYCGNFLIKAGRIDEAYEKHRAALKLRIEKNGPKSNDTAKSLYFVAHCRYLQGEYDEAERLLKDAQSIYARMYWTENRMARALFLRSMICEVRGDSEQAKALRAEAGELRKALVNIEPSDDDALELYDQMVFYH